MDKVARLSLRSPQPAKGTVLIVDDDIDFAEHLAQLIRSRGYDVETTDNGEAALLRLRAGPRPTLILLDLMMPVMDGWTLRAAMLRDPRLAAIPVAILSGVGVVENESRKLNVDNYLGKPIDLVKLYQLIDAHA